MASDFKGENRAWHENELHAQNAPEALGSPLDAVGTIEANSVVEPDVTSAIAGNGVYSFALMPTSEDQAVYLTKETGTAPEPVIEIAGSLAKASKVTDAIAPSNRIGGETTKSFGLQPNYPNPFNPETTIRYALAEASNIELRIFNVRGQLVRTLAKGHQKAGFHTVRWSGRKGREWRLSG